MGAVESFHPHYSTRPDLNEREHMSRADAERDREQRHEPGPNPELDAWFASRPRCGQPIADTGPLRCSLMAGHPFGHVYQSTSGVPDRHEKGDDE